MVALSAGLFVSFAFAVLGLPPLVGAFFAGSIVASTEYGARVSRQMSAVSAIFMGVFFTSIGFQINPNLLVGVLGLALAAIGIAVVGKVVPGVLVIPRLAGVDRVGAWRLSAVLVPRAEISLIIAQYGLLVSRRAELLPLAMMVMLGTALVPGLLVKFPRRNPPGDSRTPEGPSEDRSVGDPKR